MTDKPFQSETKQEYKENANEYFRNIQAPQVPGMSADDRITADRHLPSKQEEQKLLNKFLLLDKTTRSGAQSVAGASAAIFPSGLKAASAFIDEMTPKRLKPKPHPEPPKQQEKPTGYFPKASAKIEHLCIDCLKDIKDVEVVLGFWPMTKQEFPFLEATGLIHGDLVGYYKCVPCHSDAYKRSQDKTPLALVFDGELLPEKEIAFAKRYNRPIKIHSGVERTMGQFFMNKHKERLSYTIFDLLVQERNKPASEVLANGK